MGRDIIFCNNNGSYDEIITRVSLGSGDAWPCYLRLYFIAAYLREFKKSNKEINKDVLDTIISCCPPNVYERNYLLPNKIFDVYNHNILYSVDLYPFVQLMYLRLKSNSFAYPIIKETAKSMTKLAEFLPFTNEELKGTPYYKVCDGYNIADDRCVELCDAFNTSIKKGNNIIALIE